MKQPRIQISGVADHMNNYIQAVRNAGGLPFEGYAPEPDLTCDGLLLCGGGDIVPALYGQDDRGSDLLDPVRDQAELRLVEAFLRAGRPILGVCRGMQLLNVALGGTMIQDLPGQIKPFHTASGRDQVHPVRCAEGSLLHRLYGPVFPVNSSHHQAVDQLGNGLHATAWSEGGVVEALEHDQLPIVAVQYHPERMSFLHRREDTVDGEPLLRHFIDLCRGS